MRVLEKRSIFGGNRHGEVLTLVTGDGEGVRELHYKNGREAKNGDQVVMVNNGTIPVSGVLHGATAGNDTCNGMIRQVNGVDHYANLSECAHAEDINAGLVTLTDTSKK